MVLRRVAVELLQDGTTQKAIAERLQISRSSVKRWKKAFQQGGLAALARKPRPSATRRLYTSQALQLREILHAGPLAAGFSSDLWTCRSTFQAASATILLPRRKTQTVNGSVAAQERIRASSSPAMVMTASSDRNLSRSSETTCLYIGCYLKSRYARPQGYRYRKVIRGAPAHENSGAKLHRLCLIHGSDLPEMG